jgi:hypothetical protein
MAINILPTIDPGRDIGEGFGKGFGNALQMLGQREQQKSALEAVKSFQPTGNFLQDYAALSQMTAGVPGLENFVQTAAPMLLQQQKASIPLSGKTTGAQPQQVNSNNPDQPQDQNATQQSNLAQQQNPEEPRFITMEEYDASDRSKKFQTYDEKVRDYELQNKPYYDFKANEEAEVNRELRQQQVFDKDFDTWADQEGFNGEGKFIADKQFFRDMGNTMYQELNATNKGKNHLHDNWLKTKERLNKIKEVWQQGSQNLAKPWLEQDEWLKNGTRWADEFKKLAGNTPEIDNRLITKFTGAGVDKDYARAMVMPQSEDTKKYLKHFPKPEVQNTLQKYRSGTNQDKLDAWAQPFINAGNNGFSIFDPNESIMLFRNNMYRDGATLEQANKVINDIVAAGGVSDRQKSEWSANSNEQPSRYLLVDIMR